MREERILKKNLQTKKMRENYKEKDPRAER
jgi:hypothetical protein